MELRDWFENPDEFDKTTLNPKRNILRELSQDDMKLLASVAINPVCCCSRPAVTDPVDAETLNNAIECIAKDVEKLANGNKKEQCDGNQ